MMYVLSLENLLSGVLYSEFYHSGSVFVYEEYWRFTYSLIYPREPELLRF